MTLSTRRVFTVLSTLNLVAMAFAPQAPDAKAAPNQQLDQRILKINTAGDHGSGFVVGPDSNGRCVIITAFHVIKANAASEPLFVHTPLGQKFNLSRSAFIVDEALDLAFAPAATCSNSLAIPFARASAITVSTRVQIKGYPLDQEQGAGQRVAPATATGRISQYNDKEGYDLSYDAPTRPGYSGGPVISDGSGELIAVHGMSDTVGDSQDVDSRERLRVGGRGVSAPLLHRFLRRHGFTMSRSERAVCLVGVC